MDWATRRVVSWRVSNSMVADFCIDALEAALARHGRPEIFHSDQGSQSRAPVLPGFRRHTGSRSA
jgi:putative transposase